MANITVAEFRARFAEFRDTEKYPDSLIQLHIDDSALEVDFGKFFGPRANRAQAYWVAHQIAYSEFGAAEGGAGGPARLIASESEGDTSVSYVAPAMSDPYSDLFNLTIYGQQWLAMLRLAVPAVASTGFVHLKGPNDLRRGPFGRF